MHLFISAGEPSGDLHGSNLIRHLHARNPGLQVVGFGGDKMTAAGAKLLFPLTSLAVMWVGQVLRNIRTFFRLADDAEAYFRDHRPDAVVLIDYPGFHWHLAKRAKKHGIPVYYFVPPQLWAWAGWRVKKMRACVKKVLTALPFEDDWYRARGVDTHYVGHPYFDELRSQRLDLPFVEALKRDTVVGILPGSRNQEVTKNAPMMLAAAKRIHERLPNVKFHVAAFKPAHAELVSGMAEKIGVPVEVHVGRTPEIIEASAMALSVSGSVSLELLTRTTPAIIVYRVGAFGWFLARKIFMTVKSISLPNLLAGEALFPEFLTFRDQSAEIAGQALQWLTDESQRQSVVNRLTALRDRCAIPGACERAADFLTRELAGASPTIRKAA
jgi:lipid-A-disaccharide synthase